MVFALFDGTRIRQPVSASTGYAILVGAKSVRIDSERFQFTASFVCVQIFGLILYVVLGTWISQLVCILDQISSLLRCEIYSFFRKVLFMCLCLRILRHILPWSQNTTNRLLTEPPHR